MNIPMCFETEHRNKQLHNFRETAIKSPIKKPSAMHNLTYLLNKNPAEIRKESECKELMGDGKDYYVGGIKMNIRDIRNIAVNIHEDKKKLE